MSTDAVPLVLIIAYKLRFLIFIINICYFVLIFLIKKLMLNIGFHYVFSVVLYEIPCFYHADFKGCTVIVFTQGIWMGRRAVAQAIRWVGGGKKLVYTVSLKQRCYVISLFYCLKILSGQAVVISPFPCLKILPGLELLER